MNPISDKIHVGTLGELLVQIRLLQYGVQAAPPIKDSGNDLIAVNGREFRAVSVRTTSGSRYSKPENSRDYHVLAVVQLIGEDQEVYLDRSRIFLIPRGDVSRASTRCVELEDFAWSRELVEAIFGALRI